MDNLYDLHSWSKHHRVEGLREMSRRHLVERTDRNHRLHSKLRGVGFALSRVLSGLKW